jgi:hypothetical protein
MSRDFEDKKAGGKGISLINVVRKIDESPKRRGGFTLHSLATRPPECIGQIIDSAMRLTQYGKIAESV